MSDGGRWQSVREGYPPDGVIVLTKVKRDGRNSFVRWLTRGNGSWFDQNDRKIGWHPTHWQGGK